MLGENPRLSKGEFHINLFHEIGHAWLRQTVSDNELSKVWVNGDGRLSSNISQSEIAASYIENILRNEQSRPLRISYSSDVQTESTLIDVKSIKLSPVQMGMGINFSNRVFTMPNSVQTIYNKIMNSKK